MTIDWLHFTPWTALAGGALIGLAAALLWWPTRRIAGIHGLGGGLLTRPDGWPPPLAFTAGLIAAPLLWQRFAPLPSMEFSVSFAWMLAAGLVVGVGVKLGSGCTSGHGVCGLARLPPRPLAATLSFMATGFITVWLLRHVLGG